MEKEIIPPDYTDAVESIGPSEDDTVDEGRVETFLDNQKELNNRIMQTGPWGIQASSTNTNTSAGAPVWSQQTSTATPWGQQGVSTWQRPVTPTAATPWGSTTQSQQTTSANSYWGSLRPSTPQVTSTWGQTSTTQQAQQMQQIDRSKKVIICNFLDCIVETLDSRSVPGFIPRDIYDLTSRFDVWAKIAAINPDKVYMIMPKNLMIVTNGIPEGWTITLEHYCCCVSSFMKKPYTSCQVIVQNTLGGESKTDVVMDLISSLPDKNSILYLGVYSGYNGQSNEDIATANYCGVDYVDINVLLHNMY